MTRIDALALPVRVLVDPASLGDIEVDHYSIPGLEETGRPSVQLASEIGSAKLVLSGGEVLISRLNPRKARVVGIPDHLERVTLCSSEFVALRPTKNIEGRFLEYLLLAESTRQHLDARVQSVTRSHQRVRPSFITQMRVSIPPPSEQRGIADFLDAETARIDALVANKHEMLDLLDERDRSVIDWILGQDGTGVRLGYVAEIRSGLTLDARRPPTLDDVARPYLRVANVQPGWLDLEEVKEVRVPKDLANRTELRMGDVLMTEGGDLDKLGRGTVWRGELPKCLHQNHVFAVRPDPRFLDPDYLALVTRTSHARAYFERTGSRITNLASTNAFKVADFRIPLPHRSTQHELVEQYGRVAKYLARLSTTLTSQIGLLAEHRQALITAAVTGELDMAEAIAEEAS